MKKIICLILIMNITSFCFSQISVDKSKNNFYSEKIKLNTKNNEYTDTIITFRNYIEENDEVHFLFSQCISIELSVTWETGYDIFKKDSIVEIPFLNITYRNNCDTNYYFLKVSDSKEGLPKIPSHMRYREGDVNPYVVKGGYFYTQHANRNFNVRIGWIPCYSSGWLVHSTTVDFRNQVWSLEFINCALNSIYSYINNEVTLKDMHFCFIPSDITSENILGEIKDQFVFLKPGETFIDSYNLIAFKLLAANFTFFIDQDEIKNYVLTLENRKNIEFELPETVGEYHRYSGSFSTNKVTVCFGEQ